MKIQLKSWKVSLKCEGAPIYPLTGTTGAQAIHNVHKRYTQGRLSVFSGVLSVFTASSGPWRPGAVPVPLPAPPGPGDLPGLLRVQQPWLPRPLPPTLLHLEVPLPALPSACAPLPREDQGRLLPEGHQLPALLPGTPANGSRRPGAGPQPPRVSEPPEDEGARLLKAVCWGI